MQSNLVMVWFCVGWFVALIGFVISNDQHFIPPSSPLQRSYFRRMRPFHPINDDDSLSPYLIPRVPEPVVQRRFNKKQQQQQQQHMPPTTKASSKLIEIPSDSHANQPNEKITTDNNDNGNSTNKEWNGIFDSFNFWNVSDKPVMGNGHVAFIPYGDAIYMNGLYNGNGGQSHRARIPNYANIQFETCNRSTSTASDLNKLPQCSYALDIFNAIFRTRANFNNGQVIVDQIQYAHRYYDRTIVNRIQLQQNQNLNNFNESFQIRLSQQSGGDSEDLTINKVFNQKTIANKSVIVVDAMTTSLEDSIYQIEHTNVSILYEIVPEMIELLPDQTSMEFIWFTIIGNSSDEVVKIYEEIQQSNSNEIFAMHTNEWQQFWKQNKISVDSDIELAKTIQSSLYALASSLPSLNTSQPRSIFYGLSPSGLGLGKLLTDYQGHSFWDTEIWMHPAILLIEPGWSQELLNYRYIMRNAAQNNAITTGYKGYRYPWESAFTGRDVTQADYPNIIKYQQHITADVAHALRKHFFATHDFDWFRSVGCDLAYGTAQFWENRVQLNGTTNRYDINGIMGPDEDHTNINNNAYTNVAAALNLHFASYASCFCHQLDPIKYPLNTEWSSIAQRITLLYDQHLDYNPQYDGYNLNVTIKQADVTLLGYPLQYANIQPSTRQNNLNFYANVTRPNGPAMTWSMHTIGHLEVDAKPPTNDMFSRTYVPYVRKPYYVWNEYMNGVDDGASNFITGAGGFLQLIIYGYAGIRLNADSLTIEKIALPPNTTKLKLNGIAYMQARLEVIINEHDACVTIRGNNDFHAFIDNVQQDPTNTMFVFGHQQKFKLKPKQISYGESCPLPQDIIDPVTIN